MENFADVLAEDNNLDRRSLMERFQEARKDSLRLARIKCDCVAMLTWQLFFAHVVWTGQAIYLFIDSSPQWPGVEFYATSWEIFRRGAPFCQTVIALPCLKSLNV